MKISEVAKLSSMDRFLYWMRERYELGLRKNAGESKPWTDDEVLQSVFFTWPYREMDKTTVWFRENIRSPLKNDLRVLMATVIFRWFNYIPTGELLLSSNLLEEWSSVNAVQMLRDQRKVFTGAFNISNSGSTKPKLSRVCCDYIDPIWRDRGNLLQDLGSCTTMQAAHSRLKRYLGMGGSGFMSYEVICDLRYTYLLNDATDKCLWSNPGPGARRGLNRLLDNPLDAPVRDWSQQSIRLLKLAQKRLQGMPPLEMREVEHSLCEFWKYEKALFGIGHNKRRYTGV